MREKIHARPSAPELVAYDSDRTIGHGQPTCSFLNKKHPLRLLRCVELQSCIRFVSRDLAFYST